MINNHQCLDLQSHKTFKELFNLFHLKIHENQTHHFRIYRAFFIINSEFKAFDDEFRVTKNYLANSLLIEVPSSFKKRVNFIVKNSSRGVSLFIAF